jgi:hypothetical protein
MLNNSKLTFSKRKKKFVKENEEPFYNNWEYSSFPKIESKRLIDYVNSATHVLKLLH